MRYEHHNFSENFKAIKNTKDMAITRELMLSEVAKVIEGRPALVRKSLIRCGVRVSPRAGKVELVSAVAGSLTDKCVRVSIMKLVLSNQLPFIDGANRMQVNTRERVSDMDTDISQSEFMNHPGFIGINWGGGGGAPSGGAPTTTTTPPSSNKISGGDALGAGVQILGTIAGIWQGNKGYKEMSKQRAHEMSLAGMNRDLMLKQMEYGANEQVPPVTQAGMGGGANMTTMILLGLGVVAIIGFAIFSSRSKGKGSRPAAKSPAPAPAPATAPVVAPIS